MNIKISKLNYFLISTILFVPLILMMISWFITIYVSFSLKYYPISINDYINMSSYYSHYQESKDNLLKYKVLLLGLDGIQEESLNFNNNPDIMHKSLNEKANNYWKSVNRFNVPNHWSAANVKAAVRGGTINWKTGNYQYDNTSFFNSTLKQNSNYKCSSIQLNYKNEILSINNDYIESDIIKKIDAQNLTWDALLGINDTVVINTLFLNLINAINTNHHLLFSFNVLSDEVAHHGWTVNTKKYQYALWIENQYVKVLQELLNQRTKEFDEKWMFILFTDHGRDKTLDGQHHHLDNNSLRAWFYTNQEQEKIEKWINKPIDSNQRGLNDIKNIITSYLEQNNFN